MESIENMSVIVMNGVQEIDLASYTISKDSIFVFRRKHEIPEQDRPEEVVHQREYQQAVRLISISLVDHKTEPLNQKQFLMQIQEHVPARFKYFLLFSICKARRN